MGCIRTLFLFSNASTYGRSAKAPLLRERLGEVQLGRCICPHVVVVHDDVTQWISSGIERQDDHGVEALRLRCLLQRPKVRTAWGILDPDWRPTGQRASTRTFVDPPLHLLEIPRFGSQLLVFLGSTIGNFDADQTARFLADVRMLLKAGLIELADTGRGREKPYRAVARTIRVAPELVASGVASDRRAARLAEGQGG